MEGQSMNMKLCELFDGITSTQHLATGSRDVKPRGAFVALESGYKHIPQKIANGARLSFVKRGKGYEDITIGRAPFTALAKDWRDSQ